MQISAVARSRQARARRLFHRHRAHRPAFQPARPGSRLRRPCHLRAWCAHRLAHPSARPDPVRDQRAGWVQRDGGPIEEIRPGDVIWFAPGEKHWHGATSTTAMSHIAVQEKLNGSPVDWLEHVTDAQYAR